MALLECLAQASGYVAALTTNGLQTLGSACAQLLQGAIPTFQLNLSRYIFQLAICGCLNLIQRQSVSIEQKLIPSLLLAGFFSNLYNISYYTAAALLPLGTMIVITNVTQILNSCILNKIIFNKNVAPLKYFFIILMILGLILILQPEFIFQGVSIGSFGPTTRKVTALGYAIDSNSTAPGHVRMIGRLIHQSVPKTVLGCALAIVAGVASTSRGAVYKSKLRSVSMGPLGFWVGVLGVVPSIALMFYLDDINVKLSAIQGAFLLGHGLGAAAGSTLNIFTQQKLSPVTWAMMDNSKLVINFILQYTILSKIKPGKRNVLEVMGALVANVAIIGSVIFDIRADRKKEKELSEAKSEPTDSIKDGIELQANEKKP